MFRKICNLIIILIIVAALAVLAVLGLPLLFGNKVYPVTGNTMEPELGEGSVVIVKPANINQLSMGDIVAYEQRTTTAVSRVALIDRENGLIEISNDSNPQQALEPLAASSVLGRVSGSVPLLGYLMTGIKTTAGIISLGGMVLLVVLLLVVPELAEKSRNKKREIRSRARQLWFAQRMEAGRTVIPSAQQADHFLDVPLQPPQEEYITERQLPPQQRQTLPQTSKPMSLFDENVLSQPPVPLFDRDAPQQGTAPPTYKTGNIRQGTGQPEE